MGCCPPSGIAPAEGKPHPDQKAPQQIAPQDSRLNLTPKELFRLKKSWKAVQRNIEETAIEMMLR